MLAFTAAAGLLLDTLCTAARADTVSAPASPEAAAPLTFPELLGGLRVSTSPSGRVVVIGRTPIENLQVSQWAEDLIARVGAVTGLPCPYERDRPLTLELRAQAGGGAASEGAVSTVEPGARLVFNDIVRMPAERAREAVCGCLLSATLLRAASAGAAPEAAPEPPGWIVCGVARNVSAPQRAEDGRTVLDAWEQGRLDTLAVFLERMGAGGSAVPTGRLDRARCGFVVAWVTAGRGRGDAFSRLLATASGASTNAADLGSALAGTFTPVGLEEAWDRRVLREAHVVSRPGQSTAESVGRLRAALLLYPGLCGMPQSAEPYRTVGWPELIDMREQAWVSEFCIRKSNALRVATAGRGGEMVRVADAYCALLTGIRGGKSERKLKRLLDAAVAAEKELPGIGTPPGSENPGEGTP